MKTKTIRTSATEEIRIRYGLSHLKGNAKPYFSITANVYVSGRWESGGCQHEAVLAAWPEAAPLVALHLSDIDGVPMHGVENARYWAGFTHWQTAKVDTLAKHLRVTEEEAAALCKLDDGSFRATVLAMQPRWKAEADAAIAAFGLTVDVE
jgi:hypothetical protein